MENLTFDTVLKVEDKELKLSSINDKESCQKFLLSYIESYPNDSLLIIFFKILRKISQYFK